MKSTIKIFSETGCISHEVLWKYRQSTLSAAEKHEVELHLTDCELCSDALAGMMSMNSDKVIAELRHSIRNISAPKKVIRFYDFRILAAAAAVALLVVFTYVINSTDKNQNKEIALLTKPEEKNKEENFSISNSQLTDEVGFVKKKAEDSVPVKALTKSHAEDKSVSEVFSATDSITPVADEQPPSSHPDADKTLTTVAFNNDVTIQTPPAQSETKSSNYNVTARPAPSKALRESGVLEAQRKSSSGNKNSESSKVDYFYDLKVVHTPAMTSVEKFDSINSGTPAPYETKDEATAEVQAKEMPFVYSKTLKDGIGYYKNKKHEYAIQTFDIILDRFPNDINAIFYKGLSEMESQNYSDAISWFKEVLAHTNRTFNEEAKFKLAVCYTALSQNEDAKKLFTEIISENGFYKVRAEEELKKLE